MEVEGDRGNDKSLNTHLSPLPKPKENSYTLIESFDRMEEIKTNYSKLFPPTTGANNPNFDKASEEYKIKKHTVKLSLKDIYQVLYV